MSSCLGVYRGEEGWGSICKNEDTANEGFPREECFVESGKKSKYSDVVGTAITHLLGQFWGRLVTPRSDLATPNDLVH